MQEEVSVRQQEKKPTLWQNALKAVKGDSTQQLVEQFTEEMTLVAEGLCDDQFRLRQETEDIRREMDRSLQLVRSNIEVQDTSLQELQRDTDRQLKDISRQLTSLENRLNALEKPAKKGADKQQGFMQQITVLVGIVSGAGVLIALLHFLEKLL